jgi:hypothetical protein
MVHLNPSFAPHQRIILAQALLKSGETKDERIMSIAWSNKSMTYDEVDDVEYMGSVNSADKFLREYNLFPISNAKYQQGFELDVTTTAELLFEHEQFLDGFNYLKKQISVPTIRELLLFLEDKRNPRFNTCMKFDGIYNDKILPLCTELIELFTIFFMYHIEHRAEYRGKHLTVEDLQRKTNKYTQYISNAILETDEVRKWKLAEEKANDLCWSNPQFRKNYEVHLTHKYNQEVQSHSKKYPGLKSPKSAISKRRKNAK